MGKLKELKPGKATFGRVHVKYAVVRTVSPCKWESTKRAGMSTISSLYEYAIFIRCAYSYISGIVGRTAVSINAHACSATTYLFPKLSICSDAVPMCTAVCLRLSSADACTGCWSSTTENRRCQSASNFGIDDMCVGYSMTYVPVVYLYLTFEAGE